MWWIIIFWCGGNSNTMKRSKADDAPKTEGGDDDDDDDAIPVDPMQTIMNNITAKTRLMLDRVSGNKLSVNELLSVQCQLPKFVTYVDVPKEVSAPAEQFRDVVAKRQK